MFSVELGQPYTWKEASADLNRLSNDLATICTQKKIPSPATKADKAKRTHYLRAQQLVPAAIELYGRLGQPFHQLLSTRVCHS